MASANLCINVIQFSLALLVIVSVTCSFFENFGIILDEELYFQVVQPDEIKYTFKIARTKHFGTPFSEALYHVPLVPVIPLQGCSRPVNIEKLKGTVALVVRGECSFLSKAVLAEQYGAMAVIVMDSDFHNDNDLIYMQDDETQRKVDIPALFILGKDGYMILKTLRKLELDHAIINIPVNVSGISLHKQNQPPWVLW